MLDIKQAREEFLGNFPSQYREHVVEFSKQISGLNVDIVLLMARKSVYLFHCLEYLKLFEPGNKLVVSERWTDHSLNWVNGKSIAIVDEVIVTGTSIYKINEKLIEAGAASIEVHCLFVNTRYFVEDFFRKITLVQSFVKLDGGEAQSLSTAIVEAMHSIPRPYSVDYPISTWVHIGGDQIDCLFNLPGWRIVELPGASTLKSNNNLKTVFLVMSPKNELFEEINNFLGANIYLNALLKIRLYGISSFSNGVERYDFRIVPYVILNEIYESEMENVFQVLLNTLTPNFYKSVSESCITADSKLRFIHYIFARRLVSYWNHHIDKTSIRISFRQDSRELAYVFPKEIHSAVNVLATSKESYITFSCLPKLKSHSNSYNKVNSGYIPIVNILAEPFFQMFKEKELVLRQVALEQGRKIFTSNEHVKLLKRLEDGISIQNIKALLPPLEDNLTDQIVSTFIDITVDSGIIVPITIKKIKNGASILHRGYRHGEETYILVRDLSLFQTMLESFSREWHKKNPSLEDLHLPKILVEKLLILFFRYAVGKDFLKPSYDRLDDHSAHRIKVKVGYHKHGARLDTGDHAPTEFHPEHAFVNLLVKEGFIETHKPSGYSIINSDERQWLDTRRLAGSKLFGAVMGKILKLPTKEMSLMGHLDPTLKTKPNSKVIDELLIALTTCETAQSTLTAVAAELRLFCEYYTTGFDKDKPSLLLKKIESFQSTSYLNSARLKVKLHLNKHAASMAKNIESFFEDDTQTQSNWVEIWEASRSHRSNETEREANQELSCCLEVVLRLDLGLQELKYILMSMKPNSSQSSLNKISDKVTTALTDLRQEASELKSRERNIKANEAFAMIILRVVSDVDSYFSKIILAQPSEYLDSLCKQMRQNMAAAEVIYRNVDTRFKELGSVSMVYQFNHVLRVQIKNKAEQSIDDDNRWNELLNQIRNHILRANSGAIPRFYNQTSSETQSQLLDYQLLTSPGRNMDFEIIGKGNGVAMWFGYLIARLSKDSSKDSSMKWVALFDLDETRNFSKCRNSSEIVSNPSVQQELGYLLSNINWFDGIIVCAGYDSSNIISENFHSEYSSVMKWQASKKSAPIITQSDALGGHVSKITYESEINLKPVAFDKKRSILLITATSNERKAVLKSLSSLKIDCKEQFDENFKGHKFLYPGIGEDSVQVRIIRLEDQGPTEAAVVISQEIVKQKPDAVIMVGMCMGIPERIKQFDVIVPKEVFSLSHSRDTPDGFKQIPHPFRADKVSHQRISTIIDSATNEFQFAVVQKQIATSSIKEENPEGDLYNYIKKLSTNIVGYEMEAEGLYRALEEYKVEALLIKGVADFGSFSDIDSLNIDDERATKETVQGKAVHNALSVALSWIRHFSEKPLT